MATIRELTARLGFEFDPTPATRFDAAISRSKRNLESLDKVKLTKLRANLLKAFKIIGTAAAAAFGLGFAGFLKFSDVAQALAQLRLQAKDSFEPIRSEIKNILADPVIGKLTTELDLLNGALAVIGKGIDPGVLIRTLKPALEFAIATRQSISDVTLGISSFIADANTDLLVQLGVFDQAQLELLKVAGIDPGKQGLVSRTAFLENALAQQEGRTRKIVTDLQASGAVSQKELANTFNELLKEIGDATLPLFRDLNNILISLIETIREFVKGRLFQVIRGEITTQEFVFPQKDIEKEQEVVRAQGRRALDILEKVFITGFRTPTVGGFRGGITSGTTNNDNTTSTITVSAPITVQTAAGDDGSMIARKIGEELRKVIGTAKEQSERTTIIRGKQ